MKAPLLFDPTGGVFYDTKTNEGTKLTKLGSEGRSTSTTITAFSILNQLDDAGLQPRRPEAPQLHRQSPGCRASSRAFQRLRPGRATACRHPQGLGACPGQCAELSPTLGESVFKALELAFPGFRQPQRGTGARPGPTQLRAVPCRTILVYRAIADLRRSWRIVLPNLEQCALLTVDYADLDEIAAADEFWQDMPAVEPAESRGAQGISLHHPGFLPPRIRHPQRELPHPVRIKENEKQFREMLRPPWTLDRNEELREPFFIRFDPLHKSARLSPRAWGQPAPWGNSSSSTSTPEAKLEIESQRRPLPRISFSN